MRAVLEASTPFILANLASLDFLNNKVPLVGGKTPFYDDMSQFAGMASKKGKREYVSKRSTIHLKDSWMLRFTVNNGVGTIRLTNSKMSGDGKWNVSDLLWAGTHDYRINEASVWMPVPILYSTLMSASKGPGWKNLAKTFKTMNEAGTVKRQKIVRGHNTGAMSYYNRYAGKMFYNQTFRKGIRDELVMTFRQFILLAVENGIRSAISQMEKEGSSNPMVKDVHVSVK
jgi:hypothetical protein